MKKKDYSKLSAQYRATGKGRLSPAEVEAYLTARMPATQAALTQVFRMIEPHIPTVRTFLDIGAGPGTGLIAARSIFSEIERATLIEENPAMIAHKQVEAEWVRGRAAQADFPASDLVLFGYSYGEMEDPKILKRAWEAAQTLVLVEPGTPRGFETILRARSELIRLGGHMVAPCPHQRQCPLQGTKDWCHFSVRLPRTKEHRAIKGGKLGWEDEKFAYVAFSKRPSETTEGRILRHPQSREGHVLFELCTPEGLEKRVISRKEKALYKRAKKMKWGDSLSETVVEESDEHTGDKAVEESPDPSNDAPNK